MLHTLLMLFATGKGPPPEVTPPQWWTFLPLILMVVFFYFIVILPAQRREKRQREQLMSALKKNDRVVTSGGIIGTVSYIGEGDEVTLRLEEGKMKVLKASIVKIFGADEPAQETSKKA